PREPDRWTTTTSGFGRMTAATSATTASGVAITTSSTPSAAPATSPTRPTSGSTGQCAADSARCNDVPARPGPTIRTLLTGRQPVQAGRCGPGRRSCSVLRQRQVVATVDLADGAGDLRLGDEVGGDVAEGRQH